MVSADLEDVFVKVLINLEDALVRFIAPGSVARLAELQLREGKHFFKEQPQGSHMDAEPPWPEVIADPQVVRTIVDQLAFGRMVNGRPAKKPTDCVASRSLLLSNFEGMRCRECPVHANSENGQCSKAKVWPCVFGRALANGIAPSSG